MWARGSAPAAENDPPLGGSSRFLMLVLDEMRPLVSMESMRLTDGPTVNSWPSRLTSVERVRTVRFGSLTAAVLVVFAIVACGDDGGSGTTGTSSTSGAIDPAKALALAKQAGAVPSEITYTSGPPSEGQPPKVIGHPPSLVQEGKWYVSRETGSKIARDPIAGLEFPLRKVGAGTVIPVALSKGASTPISIAKDRGLFFANTYPSTDTVVTQFQLGLNQTLVIRGPEAPEQYSWKVAGPEGRVELQQERGEPAGLIRRFKGGYEYPLFATISPYPYDNSRSTEDPFGKRVDARLSVSDDRLMLSVRHDDRALTTHWSSTSRGSWSGPRRTPVRPVGRSE